MPPVCLLLLLLFFPFMSLRICNPQIFDVYYGLDWYIWFFKRHVQYNPFHAISINFYIKKGPFDLEEYEIAKKSLVEGKTSG